MAARNGMTQIILELRRLTDTSEDQTVVNGVSYWTDEQLQDILDKHRRDVLDVELVAYPLMEAGERVTKRYYIPDKVGQFIENDPSVLSVVDRLGNVATGFTADFAGRQINFEEDTGGSTLYIRCRTFDLNAAAAEVWLAKAGHRTALIDWKAGGQTLFEDQEYQHCMQMYKQYSGINGIRTVRMTKTGYYVG